MVQELKERAVEHRENLSQSTDALAVSEMRYVKVESCVQLVREY